MRTTDDIPERQLACYEWQPVAQAAKRLNDGDVCCVSVPAASYRRAIAEWRNGRFNDVGTERVISGVTYFAYCPVTPEDFDEEQAAKKKDESSTPELFSTEKK